jgi:hypothetical protein
MMGIEVGALLVILLYAFCLGVILLVSPKLAAPSTSKRPWWRNVRLWASLVALAQIVVYAVWG